MTKKHKTYWKGLTTPQLAERFYQDGKKQGAGKQHTCYFCMKPIRPGSQFYWGYNAPYYSAHVKCVEDLVSEYRQKAREMRQRPTVISEFTKYKKPEVVEPDPDDDEKPPKCDLDTDEPLIDATPYEEAGIVYAPLEVEKAVDDALQLQAICIRLQTDLISDLKEIAKTQGLGYQVFARNILTNFVRNGQTMPVGEAKMPIELKLESDVLKEQLAEKDKQILEMTQSLYYIQGRYDTLRELADAVLLPVLKQKLNVPPVI